MKKEYMTPKEVARYDPFGTRKKPVEEEAKELLEDHQETEEAISCRLIERAKEILGQDFLGTEAVRTMEDRLRAVGVDVQFKTDPLPIFQYNERDLELAKENGEMLVLRTETMIRDGKKMPLNLVEFMELFSKDPLGKMQTVFYAFETDANDTIRERGFATRSGEIKLGWALVKKNILDSSTNNSKAVKIQPFIQYGAELKKQGALNISTRRRTTIEAVYDELLYYINTGERLLSENYDWTQTLVTSFVDVGLFNSLGVHINVTNDSNSVTGVCPTR